VPEDYIHRVGRTARADAVGEAYTLVSPDEEADLARIERAVGARLPRRNLEGFSYDAPADAPLEVPLAERIAAIRARKAEERARAAAKAGGRGAAPAADPRASAGSRPRRRRFGRGRG